MKICHIFTLTVDKNSLCEFEDNHQMIFLQKLNENLTLLALQLFKQGCPFGNAGILGGPVSKKKNNFFKKKITSAKY